MDISLNLKNYLEEKLSNKNEKNRFLLESGITAPTLSKLLNIRLQKPSFPIIIKIADYYEDSVDSILKTEFYNVNKNKCVFIKLSKEQIAHNIYEFLNEIIKESDKDIHSLEKECNIGYNTLYSFIKNPSKNKCLSTHTLLLMSKYLKKPIDNMIGRVCINTY